MNGWSKLAKPVIRHPESPPDDSSNSSELRISKEIGVEIGIGGEIDQEGEAIPRLTPWWRIRCTDVDETETRTVSKQLRIKLQKFDGTGSWESWWAHFQNCASYNKWTKRDKLAFIKGSLTGSASQVLWDTDRSITDSLTKLLDVLKSRYGGERHAEKHRAELQLRFWKSDLHHGIL